MAANKKSEISPQLLVVSASAGSGKTRALALRYLELLFQKSVTSEAPLEQILAVTFTNKAAFEMKARILDFLKMMVLDFEDPAKKEILDCLWEKLGLKPEVLKKRAGAVLESLFRNYNYFQVETIDSFINSLIFACAFSLNLAAKIEIKKDDEPFLLFSLDKAIDAATRDPAVMAVFKNFLNQYLILENRGRWLVKEEIFTKIKRFFDIFNSHGRQLAVFKRTTNFFEAAGYIYKLLEELRDNLPEAIDGRFVASLNNYLEKNERFSLDLPQAFTSETPPIKKSASAPVSPGFRELWKKIRRNIREYCEAESFERLGPYLEIFELTKNFFDEIKQKENIIFLYELNKVAREIFREDLSLPEIYFRLATKFFHYLIDEFQDTSLLQWNNLSPLIEEALASGGTLFYVGDKKQAIYRFRAGEVTLFDAIYENFKDYSVLPEHLKANFRSAQKIIDFNNRIFSAENLKRFVACLNSGRKENLELSAEPVLKIYEDSLQKTGREAEQKGGYVEINFIEAPSSEEQDELIKKKVLEAVADLQKRNCFEMAVLCRENSTVELVSRWLLENNIAVESEKTLNIRENPLIKEIISFLMFLASPIDNLAFASFATGEIFQKVSGLKFSEIQEFLFEAKTETDNFSSGYLYKKFQEKYPALWQKLLEDFFKNVGFFNLYELVASLYGQFRIEENFPEYHGFLMKFLWLVKEKETEKPDLAGFLDYFQKAKEDELYVDVAVPKAIKVLTFHKAKGLEFEAVVIPFLELAVGISRDGLVVGENENDEKLVLYYLKKDYLEFSPKLKKIYERELEKSLIDELNNIYVALTRAKKELHVLVPKKSGLRHNLAVLLLENLAPAGVFCDGEKEIFKTRAFDVEKVAFPIRPGRRQNWLDLLKEEFIEIKTPTERENILKGEVLHLMLSKIQFIETDLPKQLESAASLAGGEFPEITDFKEFEELIIKALSQKEIRPFFLKDIGYVFTEIDLADGLGNTYRLDRMIVEKKKVIIIDFKIAAASDDQTAQKYFEQVRQYLKIAGEIYPDKIVRGFLIYFDTFKVAEVPV